MSGRITCRTYGLTMTDRTAAEFCARSYREKPERCGRCGRGRIQAELMEGRVKQINKRCPTHGAFTTTGPRGTCPKCREAEGKKPAKAPAVNPGEKSITLDFSGHQALLAEIQKQAAAEYRPLEMQIMYLLNRSMER